MQLQGQYLVIFTTASILSLLLLLLLEFYLVQTLLHIFYTLYLYDWLNQIFYIKKKIQPITL